MNIAREMIAYVASKLSLVVGTDLFQGNIPDTNATGIIVTHSGGNENETLMQRLNIHFASHYNDYDTANDKLQAVYELLAYCNGLTLTSGYVFNVVPLKLPGFVTLTEQNKYIFSCSLACFITRPQQGD
jgi:hypothetical protein